MLDVDVIHAFSDNFIWLLKPARGSLATVVDPGDAALVIAALKERGLQLGAILITHKHSDHTGGIAGLVSAFPDAAVFGPAGEPIAGLTRRLREGESIDLPGIDAGFTVIEVLGHTEGHIAYYDNRGDGVLFCGDTLFSVGCGRVFSGTFDQLHDSLSRIAALPDSTHCYCAHEYTLDNIGFARWVEPDNPALAEREQACHALLDSGRDTVPMVLRNEKACNPFLRFREPTVVAALQAHYGREMADSYDCFRSLRSWKDREYD